MLELFIIKELIICLQYHAWIIHIYQFTICLQFVSCLVIIRNNTYRYTMFLSDVEHVNHKRRRLHKRWYNLLNMHKRFRRVNIPPTPKNTSSGVLEPCNNCRITRNHISLIFGRKVSDDVAYFSCIFIWIFILNSGRGKIALHLSNQTVWKWKFIFIYIRKEIIFENSKKGWKWKENENIAS